MCTKVFVHLTLNLKKCTFYYFITFLNKMRTVYFSLINAGKGGIPLKDDREISLLE